MPWPSHRVQVSAENEVLTLLAGTARQRAASAARCRALLAACQPDALGRRLDALRLTGVLGPRLLALVPEPRFDELAAHVEEWVVGHRAGGQVLALVMRTVCDELERAGVPALPLKGSGLAGRLYADVGARPSEDIDLLVGPDQIDASIRVLAPLGYLPTSRPDEPWLRELHHTLGHRSPSMPPIELHHRIEWYAGAPFALDVLARTTCARGARRAAPADELALLLLIFARDGFPGLRLPADLAAWWDRHGSQLPDQPLRSIAEVHAALARPLATAALVAERLVGLPAAHLLDLAPAAGRRSRLAAALADPLLQHGPAGPTLVDGLLCDRRALRGWTRRRVLPPRGHVARTYGLPKARGPRVTLLQAIHPARVGVRLAEAALRARKRPPAGRP